MSVLRSMTIRSTPTGADSRPRKDFMLIRVGYELVFDVPSPTPIMFLLYLHPSRDGTLRQGDKLVVEPGGAAGHLPLLPENPGRAQGARDRACLDPETRGAHGQSVGAVGIHEDDVLVVPVRPEECLQQAQEVRLSSAHAIRDPVHRVQADPERAPVSSHSTSAPGVTLPARGMGSAASTSVRCSTESAMMNAAIR